MHDVLRTPGEPLKGPVRASMEARFGHKFDQIRVHTDSRAGESARAINSLAYTVGNDIVFAPGQFLPSTTSGQQLLAHELAHTIQQNASDHGDPAATQGLYVNQSNDAAEEEAQRAATQVMLGRSEFALRQTAPIGYDIQRAEPASTVTIGSVAAKCIIGAIIGALFDVGIQAALHSLRERTWRFWEVSLNYCSIILSAILGCIAAPISAFALEPWIAEKLGSRLGGMAGTLIGKILLFIAKKLGMAVPKSIVAKLAKLGCISPEQAAELGVRKGQREAEA